MLKNKRLEHFVWDAGNPLNQKTTEPRNHNVSTTGVLPCLTIPFPKFVKSRVWEILSIIHVCGQEGTTH